MENKRIENLQFVAKDENVIVFESMYSNCFPIFSIKSYRWMLHVLWFLFPLAVYFGISEFESVIWFFAASTSSIASLVFSIERKRKPLYAIQIAFLLLFSLHLNSHRDQLYSDLCIAMLALSPIPLFAFIYSAFRLYRAYMIPWIEFDRGDREIKIYKSSRVNRLIDFYPWNSSYIQLSAINTPHGKNTTQQIFSINLAISQELNIRIKELARTHNDEFSAFDKTIKRHPYSDEEKGIADALRNADKDYKKEIIKNPWCESRIKLIRKDLDLWYSNEQSQFDSIEISQCVKFM